MKISLTMKELTEQHGENLKLKLSDPVFFINEIIGLPSDKDGTPGKLTPYQKEWLDLLELGEARLNLMAFRSSGKTELLFVDYPIFKAFTQKGWQGIITSKTEKQAISILRRIREKITMSDILRTAIPTGKSILWSKTELQLKNGSMIWSRPSNENLPGEHVDFIGGDEIGYWDNMDIITKVIPPMVLAKRGTVAFVGTPTSQTDAIHQLHKNPAYTSKMYPATMKWNDGKTLWEHRYPDNPMGSVRKQYDALSWSREFLCKPLSSSTKIFPYELVSKCFDFNAPFTEGAIDRRTYYMGADFALSGEAQSDYTVITILEKNEETVRVVNIERYKGMSYQAQKARIVQMYNDYRCVKITADAGSFGKAFIQDLRNDSLNVQEFRFTQLSKQDMITNLRNFFEQKKIIINKNEDDIRTKQVTDILVKELSSFGVMYDEKKMTVKFQGLGEHDDTVMSLGLACYGARGFGEVCLEVRRSSVRGSKGIFLIS